MEIRRSPIPCLLRRAVVILVALSAVLSVSGLTSAQGDVHPTTHSSRQKHVTPPPTPRASPGIVPVSLFATLLAEERAKPDPTPIASGPVRYPAVVPEVISSGQARLQRQMDPTTPIHLEFKLETHHPDRLQQLLKDQQTKGNRWFHRFLSVQQFADAFAPSPADYASIQAYLSRQGFTTKSYSSRLRIEADGTVAQAEHTLNTTLNVYRLPDGRVAFAPSVPPSLPPNVGTVVAGVSGLDSVRVATRASGFEATSASLSPCGNTQWGPGCSGLSPDGLAAAYDVAPLQSAVGNDYYANNVTIALIELTNVDPNALKTDLTTFDNAFNYPSTNVNLVTIGNPCTVTAPVSGLEETDLDVQFSHGIAPAANITVYAANSGLSILGYCPNLAQMSDLESMYAQAISDATGPLVISSSWGTALGTGDVPGNNFDDLLAEAAAQGVTVLQASGDCGAYGYNAGLSGDCKTNTFGLTGWYNQWMYPQVSPYVTDVGGTRLCVANGGAVSTSTDEIGWQDGTGGKGCTNPAVSPSSGDFAASGGGFSAYAQPYWQTAVIPGSSGHRGVPDISFNAAGHPGFAVYDASAGGWALVGGTSGAAPFFAGVVALTDAYLGNSGLPPIGFASPLLYDLSGSAVLRSIPYTTDGQNQVVAQSYPPGSACPTGYNSEDTCLAQGSWNSVVGLGSVDAWAFAQSAAELPLPLYPPTFPAPAFPSEPQGIAAAPDGSVWYADAAANVIGHFNATSLNFDTHPLSTANAFPQGLAIDPRTGDIWFTESSDGQIGRIPASGAPGSTALEYPIPYGSDSVPIGIGVDRAGNVWFAENAFDQIGELTLGANGVPNFQVYPLPWDCAGPEGAIVDPGGNVWTACEDSPSIAERTTSGQLLNFPVSAAPEQLVVDSSGGIWFTEWPQAYVGRIDPSTAVAESDPTNDPGLIELAVPNSGWATPSGIWIDANGGVWYTDAADQSIGQFNPATGAFATITVPRPISTWPEGNEGNGLTIDAAGNVWYSAYTTNGDGTTTGYLGELPASAVGLAGTTGGVVGGIVGTALTVGVSGDEIAVPANTFVSLPTGAPFTGSLSSPVPVTSLLPPPSSGTLVPGSVYNVAATSITGQQVSVSFSQPTTITFPVSLPPGTAAYGAQIWSYDPVSQTWAQAGTEAGDPGGTIGGGTATIRTTRLTILGVVVGIPPAIHRVFLPEVHR